MPTINIIFGICALAGAFYIIDGICCEDKVEKVSDITLGILLILICIICVCHYILTGSVV